MSADYQKRQAELVAEHLQAGYCYLHGTNPGRSAPELVTRKWLRMKPGSVIVDLAVEQGGNCNCPRGKIVQHKGVYCRAP